MRDYWASVSIGKLCKLINGRAFKPTDWTTDGLPIVRIQNLNDPSKPFNFYNGEVNPKFLIDTGDILLSWSGTPGTSFGCFIWRNGAAILNQHIFKVQVDRDTIDEDFFVFAVNSKLDEMIRLAHGGVGLRHITKGKLEGIELPVPPLPEQKRIVTRIRECLERVHEIEILQDEALIESNSLFESFVESQIEPEWRWSLISEITTDIRNGWSWKESSTGQSAQVLRLSSVRNLSLDVNEVKTACLKSSQGEEFSLKKNDVFIVRGNGSKHLVGRSAISTDNYPSIVFNDLLIRLRFTPKMLPEFANFMLHSRKVREQIEQVAKTAAGIWKINQTGIRSLKLPCPSIEVQQEKLVALKEGLAASKQIVQHFSQTDTKVLSDAILRKAFTGEL